MDHSIQVIINQVEYILLSEQKLNDYNPPESRTIDVKPTKVCFCHSKNLGNYSSFRMHQRTYKAL